MLHGNIEILIFTFVSFHVFLFIFTDIYNKMIKPYTCNPCYLSKISNGFILPEGLGTSGVAIIGEGGGYEEYLDGLPFRPKAQAGSKLEEVFKLVSNDLNRPISRSQFYINNIVACNPPGDKLSNTPYETQVTSYCTSQYLDRYIEQHSNIKCILALGNVPLKNLTGVSGIADEKESVSHLRGYVLESRYGIPVITGYHPAFLKRGNGHLTPSLVEDLKKAIKVASGEYNSYGFHSDFKKPRYFEYPSIEEFESYYKFLLNNRNLPIFHDIETPYSAGTEEDEREELDNDNEIKQVQFSHKKRFGIAVPYTGDYIKFIHNIYSLPNDKLGFNSWNFDRPRLLNNSISINGIHHDLMWMFKHYHPRLERGLQKVASLFDFPYPWKHLFGSKLAFYGCCDVDAPAYIYEKLPGLMKARGVWRGYEEHVRGIYTILTKGSEERGIPVSEEKRIILEKELIIERKELQDGLQRIIPDEVKNLTPRRKNKNTGVVSFGYIREPIEVRESKEIYIQLKEYLQSKGKPIASFRRFVKRKYGLVLREFKQVGEDGNIIEVKRWCNLEEWNPGSPKQVIKYLQNTKKLLLAQSEEIRNGIIEGTKKDAKDLERLAKEYEVPISLKTKKETTSAEELEEMYYKTGDEVLETVMNIRSINTNINNFIPNWKPGEDGRVHSEWNFGPPSGQLATRKPNSQNVSKYTNIGQLFRGIIEAPEGYVFVELDKKSFHVATMGYVANDPDYIRFSQLDPHSIFTSFVLPEFEPVDFRWSDIDILEYCKEIKKWCKQQREKDPIHGVDFRQDCAKPAVLGNQLGLGPIKLQRQNRRTIKDVQMAKTLQIILAERFDKVHRFKDYIREKAWRQNFLINEFWRIQYFHDIYSFRYNKKRLDWDRGAGQEYNEPVAFSVQSPAFGMITEELRECDRLGYCEEYSWLGTIHDSLIFMPEVKRMEECIENVSKVMSMPCKYLVNAATGIEGLVVKVESSWGKNWRNYDKEKNPEGMREY
jgi:uracil-DNA glycosylase family 4